MPTTSLLLMLALTLMILVQSLFFVLHSRQIRALKEELSRVASEQNAALNANAKSLVKLQATITVLEKKLNRTVQRQQDLENKDAGSLTYEQASKLIELGAAPEDLVKTCGLSQAEAHLVSLMAARGLGKSS
ncbi:DUF2802 domain-containing protein [Gammaproteobacteria bacterium LSUCC0112]|nr:DUF2802 domain-containing protein [Gammaproteobacteria bacterium LSUCC0112]